MAFYINLMVATFGCREIVITPLNNGYVLIYLFCLYTSFMINVIIFAAKEFDETTKPTLFLFFLLQIGVKVHMVESNNKLPCLLKLQLRISHLIFLGKIWMQSLSSFLCRLNFSKHL